MSCLRWGCAIAGLLIVASTMRPLSAEELFGFADDATIADAMSAIKAEVGHDAVVPDPCRLFILSDRRGHALFDDTTSTLMHRALAANVLGADRVEGCAVESREVSQDAIAGFLEERRASGDPGLILGLTYYKLNEGVTVFASLRDEGGNLLGSSGRIDLPVEASTDGGSVGLAEAEAGEKIEGRSQPANQAAATNQARAEPATEIDRPSAGVRQPRQPTGDDGPSEASLRRQFAAEARVEKTPSRPFNLRRIQAGTPPSIKTVRVVDAGGEDEGLIAALAGRFVDTLERTPGSAAPAADSDLVDLQLANNGAAFRQLLGNQADILVTRQPISSTDAARFAQIYGVNMRSRYAERVVAIASKDSGSLDCGIRYPQNDMLMSTEDHPSSERIYIYANPSIPSAMRDQFIDFTLSAEGQAVVAKHAVDLRLQLSGAGYAAWRYQAVGEQEAELQDARDRFRGLIRTSQRVSSTFRFDFASADLVLDARSEQDLENLIDLVKARDIDARRILLFGFADSAGAARFNVDLSRSRADAVATRLRLAGIPVPPRNIHGIGEDSPVACNSQRDGDRDEVGARKNRRVEVWIES
ncbi:MAG: OmpA family protein [Geminicoccaceae bacterium]